MPPFRTRFIRAAVRYSPYAVGAVGRAVKYGTMALQGYRKYQAFRQALQPQGKRTTSGVVTTQQQDYKTQYVKKRMPRRRKKAWKKFTKKVVAVQKNALGTRTWLTNGAISQTTSTTFPQNFSVALMYGFRGTAAANEIGVNDLDSLVARELSATPNNLKFTVYSAILDVTIVNTSAPDAGFTPSIEVDIYHVKFYRESNFANFGAAHARAITDDANLPNSPTAAANRAQLTQRGATLFDVPILISKTGMKILKKTKVFLAPNQQTTYQIRNPKNITFSAQDIREGATTGDTFAYPKHTEGIIVVHKPVVNAGNVVNTTMSMGVTRKYCYVVDSDAVTRSAYN